MTAATIPRFAVGPPGKPRRPFVTRLSMNRLAPPAQDPGRRVVAPRVDRKPVVVEAPGRRELPKQAQLPPRLGEEVPQPGVVALGALRVGRGEPALAQVGDL